MHVANISRIYAWHYLTDESASWQMLHFTPGNRNFVNEALPEPTIIPARKTVKAYLPLFKISSTFLLELRCLENTFSLEIPFTYVSAEKLSINFTIRHGSAAPANLTRLSTKMMLAIHDSLVSLSLALIRFSPKLNLCLTFPTDNGPNLGLMDTNNTVFDAVRPGIIHLLLLFIECIDNQCIERRF